MEGVVYLLSLFMVYSLLFPCFPVFLLLACLFLLSFLWISSRHDRERRARNSHSYSYLLSLSSVIFFTHQPKREDKYIVLKMGGSFVEDFLATVCKDVAWQVSCLSTLSIERGGAMESLLRHLYNYRKPYICLDTSVLHTYIHYIDIVI